MMRVDIHCALNHLHKQTIHRYEMHKRGIAGKRGLLKVAIGE